MEMVVEDRGEMGGDGWWVGVVEIKDRGVGVGVCVKFGDGMEDGLGVVDEIGVVGEVGFGVGVY